MTTTGLSTFDETVQLTHTWLNEIMTRLNWDDKQRAYRLLRATLHALRDRLPPDEAVQLDAQLPMLIRGFYYEGWHPGGKPVAERTKDQFLSHIEDAFSQDPSSNVEEMAQAVFAVVSAHVSSGEVEDIKHILPKEVRDLWPA